MLAELGFSQVGSPINRGSNFSYSSAGFYFKKLWKTGGYVKYQGLENGCLNVLKRESRTFQDPSSKLIS